MKLTKQRLNRIIQEELARALREQDAMRRARDPRREEAPAQDLPDWTDPHRDPNAPKKDIYRKPYVPGEGGTPEYWQREVGEGGPPLPDPGWSPAKSPGPARDIDPGWSPRRSPGPVRDIDPGWSPDQRVHQAPIPAREVGEGGPPRGFDPSKNVAPDLMPRRKEDDPMYDPNRGMPAPQFPLKPNPVPESDPGRYELQETRLNRIIQEEYEKMLLENDEYSKYRDQHNYPPAQLEDPNLDFGVLAPGWVDDVDGPLPTGPEADVAHGDRVANEYETGAYADFNPAYGIPPGGIDSWERQPQVRDTIRGIGPQNDQGYSREAVRGRAARSNVTVLPGWGSSGHNVVPNLQESLTRQIERYIYKTLRG